MSAKSAKAVPVVRSRWFDTTTVPGTPVGPGLTKQEFKDECDVNLILRRYQDAPPRAWSNPPRLRYGDFAEANDFLDAQLLVKQAEEQFNSLPAELRDRFANSPSRFLDFLHRPENAAEARKLGLLNPEPPPPPAAPSP